MSEFTHLDSAGHARMVDVSQKDVTKREAIAAARVIVAPETLARLRAGGMPKGDVLATARIAGIMAAKKTPDLIPLCHPLALTGVEVELTLNAAECAVDIRATARVTGKTGVEIEALTAASIAALTIYDMCKSVDRGMRITDVRLLHKSGGRSGTFEAG